MYLYIRLKDSTLTQCHRSLINVSPGPPGPGEVPLMDYMEEVKELQPRVTSPDDSSRVVINIPLLPFM